MAAIGMAAGGGMYVVAVFVTVVGLAALTLLRRFEDRGEPIARQRVTVTMEEGAQSVGTVVDALGQRVAVVSQEEYERDADGRVRITMEVRMPAAVHGHELARALDGLSGVRAVKIERL